MEPALLSGAGRLEAWTTIRVAPAGFDAPYVLGYVRLDEGPRVLALVDAPVAALDFGRAMEVEPAGSAGRPPRPTGGLRARVAPEAARAAAAPHPEVARG